MTDAEIKNLRDLMRAATPGPWRHEAWGSRILDSGVGSSQLLIATVAANTFRDQGRHNAEFIAACNPVAIRALLDRLKAAEGENERLREFERSAALTLPGVYYMDPPDGGDVSLLKQLQRMSIDAARYRLLRRQRDVLLDMLDRSGVRYDEIARAIDRDARDARAEVGAKEGGE